MSYRLGVDLGTTWTAAATWRGDRATIVSLGQRRAAIPSVTVLRDDGEFLVGDAAARRAVAEPERVAREFKRRIGDTTPLIVGGTPQTPESLTAHLLRFVVDQVSALEGSPPAQLAVAHPANWGDFKIDLLRRIIGEAGHDANACLLITEPEAAAITYATEARVPVGKRVCVYDLGGGTFDTAVVERTDSGFRILGRPQGIERLGGVDFDAAIFASVTDQLGGALAELDPGDPAALSALARLRLDCTEAKEALSADVSATIPVFLPSLQTEIRITRSEFESLIRPVLADTIETTRRAIASADLEPSDIERVLLVGGSSRIPLVSQLVQNELNVQTAIDSHPKHAIALGTAIHHLASNPGPGAGVTIVNDGRLHRQPDDQPPAPSAAEPPGAGPGTTGPTPTPGPAASPPAADAGVPDLLDEDLDPDDLDRIDRPGGPGPAPTPQRSPSAGQPPPAAKPGGGRQAAAPGGGPPPQARPATPAPGSGAGAPGPAPGRDRGQEAGGPQSPGPAPPPGPGPNQPGPTPTPKPSPSPASTPGAAPASPPPTGTRPQKAQPAEVPPGVTPPPLNPPKQRSRQRSKQPDAAAPAAAPAKAAPAQAAPANPVGTPPPGGAPRQAPPRAPGSPSPGAAPPQAPPRAPAGAPGAAPPAGSHGAKPPSSSSDVAYGAPSGIPRPNPIADPATSILPGAATPPNRSGHTEIQPPPGRATPAGRSRGGVVIVVVLILLFLAFGVGAFLISTTSLLS